MSGAATHGARPGRRIMHSGTFPGSEHARCALPEYAHVDFFPELARPANRVQLVQYRNDIAQAKHVCHGCEVREPCLTAALATPSHHDHGVLGGTTPKERNRLRKGIRA